MTKEEEQYMDILLKEKDNQFQIYKNKLAAALKLEYWNHKDGLEMEMTKELGENYRDEMTEIFKTLKKFGIDVKEYNKL